MTNFEKEINYTFKSQKYLNQAFTHSSYAHENKIDYLHNNERLEFLGDAVLELTISDYIFGKYTEMPEGELTKLRASVVCESMLAKMARRINIGDCLKLGKGEAATGGRDRDSILADAFEAVIGAIYLDSGLTTAQKFVLSMMLDEIDAMRSNFRMNDCKTYLQEIVQRTSKSPLEYVIVSEKGPDHNKAFFANVIHEERVLGKGVGKSKKEAEQNAAFDAVKALNIH